MVAEFTVGWCLASDAVYWSARLPQLRPFIFFCCSPGGTRQLGAANCAGRSYFQQGRRFSRTLGASSFIHAKRDNTGVSSCRTVSFLVRPVYMAMAVSIAAVLLLSNVSACEQTGDAEAVTRRATKSPIQHFVAIPFDRFPRSVVMCDFCDTDDGNCLPEVRSSGAVDDGEQNIRWVSLKRASVWGIRSGRAFLLAAGFGPVHKRLPVLAPQSSNSHGLGFIDEPDAPHECLES